MINKDFVEFPSTGPTFLLLQAVNYHCFRGVPVYPLPATVQAGAGLHHLGLQAHDVDRGRHRPEHPQPAAAERVGAGPEAAQSFYKTYYTAHPAAHVSVVHGLRRTRRASPCRDIRLHVSLRRARSLSNPSESNGTGSHTGGNDRVTGAKRLTYAQDFVANLSRTAFPPDRQPDQDHGPGLVLNPGPRHPAFKEHSRDFLVQIREFTNYGEDDSRPVPGRARDGSQAGPGREEEDTDSVPGMLNPHEAEEMQEM